MMPDNYSKATHDKEHQTLIPDECVWCKWEIDDMEDRTRGTT